MPKTTFVNGTVVTSEWLNSVQNLMFDGLDYDGHYPKITNNDLSDAAGQIKPEWTAFRDALKISAATGLSISCTGGVVTLPSGALATVAPQTLALANNATNYVYLNEAGTLVASTIYPVIALPLAKVTTVNGVISGSIVDLRPRFQISALSNAVKVFGGTGGQGDYSLSGTAIFDQGYYYFRNFTIASSATLTINQFAKIFCSGSVAINGTIAVSQFSSGGTSFLTPLSSVNLGGISGTGPGAGSGGNIGGTPYSYAAAAYGSGGGSGFASSSGTSTSVQLAGGGKGGGGLWIESAGSITVGGTITAIGGNGGVPLNAIGTGVNASGGGGGSGGLILLSSLTDVNVTAAGTLNVSGGSGGSAFGNASGGGGGGGGQIVLISPNNNATGSTIVRTGGSLGASGSGGNALGGGGGGGFGGAGGFGSGGGNGLLILRNFASVGS